MQPEFFATRCDASENGCLVWRGAKNSSGYGVFRKKGKNFYAHRAAWECRNGAIPEGRVVCHCCDNPACCNPEHMFIGSQRENLSDMVQKGRSAKGVGHSQAKLTDEQVVKIRERFAAGGATHAEVARDFGISREAVGQIVRRQRWAHI